MNRSDTLSKIAPALVIALGKIEGAAKKKTNPGFKSKYADLETVIDASRDILTKHGLTLMQFPGACVNGVMSLETVIMHESGEFVSGDMGIVLGKQDPQGVGSALSYARRYAQMAVLNMPSVDDDAQAAMGRGANQNTQTKPPAAGLTVATAKIAMDNCGNLDALEKWALDNKPLTNAMSDDDYKATVDYWKARRAVLTADQQAAA